jgi:hypothetical protein
METAQTMPTPTARNSSSDTLDMADDWRYNDQKMETRQRAYSILLNRFGSQLDKDGAPLYNMKAITECAHDWVSQGNSRCDGIVAYFKAYYA